MTAKFVIEEEVWLHYQANIDPRSVYVIGDVALSAYSNYVYLVRNHPNYAGFWVKENEISKVKIKKEYKVGDIVKGTITGNTYRIIGLHQNFYWMEHITEKSNPFTLSSTDFNERYE